MAEKLDEKEDLASSDQAEIDVADMPDAGKEADAGSSPAAKDEAKTEDTLSIVRDVVAPKEGAVAAEGSSPKGKEAETDPEPVQPDDTNFTDVPFHKHPRFQQLLRQKKEADVDATQYRNITRFMSDNGLTAEEVADGMQIMALARANPALAWERLRPWAERVAIAAGVILPSDMQQRVARGELTPQAAQELSLATARAKAFEAQRQFDVQRQQERDREMQANSLRETANSWAETRKLRDPNFDAKIDPLQREIAFLQATEGKPSTPDGVRAQLERAYAAVNANYRPPAPPRPAAAPKPATAPVRGGQVAGNVREAPRSTLEIIQSTVASRA